jgi:hypothetical protein
MRPETKRCLARIGWGSAGVLSLLAAGTASGLRLPLAPLGQLWLAQGTLRFETNPAPPGWRGHPMEVRLQGVARGYVIEIGVGPLVVGAGAFLGLVWAARRSPVGPGICVECGYDLQGVAGVCPECGADIAGRPSYG